MTHSGLKKFGYDLCSWPLYVANVHKQPGRLICEDCKSPTNQLKMNSTVSSRFVFIEFAPEIMESLIMYEKIEIDNSFYVLKALVCNYNVHFTCAIHNDKKWLYFDDLNKNVREFASVELLQRQFPGGWFFALFELFWDNDVDDSKTASATQTKKISENQGIDNQHLFNELRDVRNCNVWQTSEVELQIKEKDQISPSVSCQPNMATHGSKKVNPANTKSHPKGKKRKLTDYVKTDKNMGKIWGTLFTTVSFNNDK